MKFNKLKAFTLAEVMILLLTLSILLAAFAPVFTRRYSGAGSDQVWSYVPNDSNYDAYYNVLGETLKAQAFIGLTPTDKFDVQKFTSDNSNNILNSKLIIAAANDLGNNSYPLRSSQKHFQFRYGDNAGNLAGSLFAGNTNILIGGQYNNLKQPEGHDIKGNTSFGYDSLTSLDSSSGSPSHNTAIGYKTLMAVVKSSYNTVIGADTATSISTVTSPIGYGNTLLGMEIAKTSTGGFSYNTAIGYNSLNNAGTDYNNTTVGDYTIGDSAGQNRHSNIALGHYSLNKLKKGDGNTAIGYQALGNLVNGYYNTAIGANSCQLNENGSYITCIGANSGNKGTGWSASEPDEKYFKTGNDPYNEVVLIGSYPEIGSATIFDKSTYGQPAAVLEVHKGKSGKNSKSLPSPEFGNESVVVNGHLVVRGSSYFEVPLIRRVNVDQNNSEYIKQVPKGLVAFAYMKDDFASGNLNMFAGIDGSLREGKSYHRCGGGGTRCRQHAFNTNRSNCICTAVTGASGSTCAPSSTRFLPSNFGLSKNKDHKVDFVAGPSKSYDWFSKTDNDNGIAGTCYNEGTSYTDKSFNCKIDLEHWYQHGEQQGSNRGRISPGVDNSYAHIKAPYSYGTDNTSCCPNLSPDMPSDVRLKDLGEKFTAGLDEIRKLNIYNYTFKNDSNKLPQVGVIAQELKLIFPSAVSEDENGYYRIRWDEMFYAAINSIKTLNTKIEALASKIAADNNRIAILKKDNAELNAKLDKLSDELTQLEAKKRK